MKLNTPETIAKQAQDAHEHTLLLLKDLTQKQLIGPILSTVNPLRWEVGHAAYFYEFWVLRHHLKQLPIIDTADALYDSITIAHDDRWGLPLPELQNTLDYMDEVLKQIKICLQQGEDEQRDYLAQYAVFHQDMHNEAYTYTRQTLNYPAPKFKNSLTHKTQTLNAPKDAFIPGGQFNLGAYQNNGFAFDNEKWAHEVSIKPFHISKTAVSNAEYLKFVQSEGYSTQQHWSDEGWEWVQNKNLIQPVYWRQHNSYWQIKQFDQWIEMPPNAALIHVSWYEAQAYCHWANRRLPTEVEWEAAASAEPSSDGSKLSTKKRYYPWGDSDPKANLANLDFQNLGTADVNDFAEGDSAFGCRQMLGNVWEWTEDTFKPYPKFQPDMYSDYSQPLFNITKVLRGGAWTTRSRMIRNTWRTYYGPDRNDVFAGFRTCKKDS